jgi:tRNA pseudouridine32 synthase / 23S rRNA pseudouridine746 synthase
MLLHALSDFIADDFSNSSPNYWYEGGKVRLPRTAMSEAIAMSLMRSLAADDSYAHEGKMYGILIVELEGTQWILKAFSGLLKGCSVVEGWVPPIPGRDQVALVEAHTLALLEAMKQELITLNQLPIRQQYEDLQREFELRWQTLSDRHQNRQHQRQEKRQLLSQDLTALEQLNEESRQDGIERRTLKRQRQQVLQPLQQLITAADTQMRELKQRRKELSRQLQAQMHAAYSLTNFAGQSLSLLNLISGGIPTGTGDCCAPKLLHYAATHGLKPLAMAEFWWGPSAQDKISGEFYGACVERCQPLMGFLLSGLSEQEQGVEENLVPHLCEVKILYEDEWLIAVDKPAGLLSVPGRYLHSQDSVESRLRNSLSAEITAVHRLDQDTSGIMLLARDRLKYSQLSQMFEQRQIHKIYEAVLSGVLTTDSGVIELPLWGDPENRPYQQVDWERGSKSVTHFRVMSTDRYTRVEFTPVTGRTHQLRVHAADARGLDMAILGDRLYGCHVPASRLHLHARELWFEHPYSGETVHLRSQTPF